MDMAGQRPARQARSLPHGDGCSAASRRYTATREFPPSSTSPLHLACAARIARDGAGALGVAGDEGRSIARPMEGAVLVVAAGQAVRQQHRLAPGAPMRAVRCDGWRDGHAAGAGRGARGVRRRGLHPAVRRDAPRSGWLAATAGAGATAAL